MSHGPEKEDSYTKQLVHSLPLADLGGRARRAPPHLPGILVFDDILGHIALADLGGRTRRVPPHLPGILVFDDILGHIV